MAFLRTEAVVIKAINLREADKIITFFSKEYGKVQGIAKGIRKIKTKYSGKLELFNRVQVIFFQKTTPFQGSGSQASHPLFRVTQVDVVEVFPELQRDFNKIIGASYIAEFLNKLFEEHDATHKDVYDLVCETFRTLASSDALRNIISAFEIKLLAHLGYAPILDHCAVCRQKVKGEEQKAKEERSFGSAQDRLQAKGEGETVASSYVAAVGFSSSAGGILCQRCKPRKMDSITISPQSVEILQRFLSTKMNQVPTLPLPKGKYPEIKNLLMSHYQYHLGISLKTESFVQKLRSANFSI